MVGFFKLKNDSLTDQINTGNAIIRVSKSVFQNTPTSEWKKFNDDTRGWLFANGYRYKGTDAGPNGEIPASVNIVPVYDTPNTMHVRVPWSGNLEHPPARPPKIDDELSYGAPNSPNKLPVVLARYFMRKCR